MDHNEDKAKEIKQSFEKVLGTDLILKRKKRNNSDFRRKAFEQLILNIERTITRSNILTNDFDLDITDYNNSFYEIIDTLIYNLFGHEASEVIFFYLYERLNPDGTLSDFEVKDSKGNVLPLNNSTDLWNIVNDLINNK
jgi:hypothetical protein